MATGRNKSVVILQHRLLHYRLDFFEKLREYCFLRNISLDLVHGQPSEAESIRRDDSSLPWAHRVRNTYFNIGGRDILWQPIPSRLKSPDLLIMMQENRILSNYPYLMGFKPRAVKTAYWGHGANFQSRAPGGIRERWKNALIRRVDWWFAYTSATVDIVKASGFPENRISCLNNAVDTQAFREEVMKIDAGQKHEIRAALQIPNDAPVAVFCGSLYEDKRLDLLVASCDVVRKAVPGFHLVVLGDGPGGHWMREMARTRPWLKILGVTKGMDKARWFSTADVMLNPGLLGLHILDSFSIGLPLVSTLNAAHSPEIVYIDNGSNGLLVGPSPDEYANAVVRLLSDNAYWNSISAAARVSGERYTVDAMVENFGRGICGCLDSPALH